MNIDLPEKIMREIKKRNLVPRPRWQFLLKRSVIWSIALCATVLGGIAVSVIIFIFIDHDASARASLSESFFEDLLHIIPYLWIITLVVLIGISQYAIRHAEFGYRYTTAWILSVVVVSSLALGAILSVLEVGERIEDFFVERVPYYDKLTSTSHEAWAHPEKGLLGGTVTTLLDSTEFELTDLDGKKWVIDFERVDEDGKSLIRQGAILKIIGAMEDASTFRAVKVSPWE